MNRKRLAQRIALFAALLLVTTMPVLHAAAAPIPLAGHWEADVKGDEQVFTFAFDFKTNGDVLTGTLGITSQTRTFEIKQGKIKGNAISFVGFGIWTGALNGEELSLTRELDDGKKQNMSAHRIN